MALQVIDRTAVSGAVPGEVFSYVLESGLAIRDYKAVVTLTPAEGGTAIRWRSTFRAKVPGTGGLYRRQLGTFIGRTLEGLAAAAARAPHAGGTGPGAGAEARTGVRPPPSAP